MQLVKLCVSKYNLSLPGADCESQDESVSDFGWSYVNLSFVIDALAELLIDLVAANKSKTDQTKSGWNWQLKSLVLLYKFSKFFSKFDLNIVEIYLLVTFGSDYLCSDVFLKTLHPVQSEDKPKFQ